MEAGTTPGVTAVHMRDCCQGEQALDVLQYFVCEDCSCGVKRTEQARITEYLTCDVIAEKASVSFTRALCILIFIIANRNADATI